MRNRSSNDNWDDEWEEGHDQRQRKPGRGSGRHKRGRSKRPWGEASDCDESGIGLSRGESLWVPQRNVAFGQNAKDVNKLAGYRLVLAASDVTALNAEARVYPGTTRREFGKYAIYTFQPQAEHWEHEHSRGQTGQTYFKIHEVEIEKLSVLLKGTEPERGKLSEDGLKELAWVEARWQTDVERGLVVRNGNRSGGVEHV